MMLPEGWVTDVLTHRGAALKCLGNGVVPLQAASAIRYCLQALQASSSDEPKVGFDQGESK